MAQDALSEASVAIAVSLPLWARAVLRVHGRLLLGVDELLDDQLLLHSLVKGQPLTRVPRLTSRLIERNVMSSWKMRW